MMKRFSKQILAVALIGTVSSSNLITGVSANTPSAHEEYLKATGGHPAASIPGADSIPGTTAGQQASAGQGQQAVMYGGSGGKVLITSEMKEEYTTDFVAFDSDKNNLLDPQEVTANFQGQVKAREMYEFFRTADKNSDGKVSLVEYIDYAADLTADNKNEL